MTRGTKKTRRQFLADTAAIAAGASVASCFPEVGGDWPIERSGCFEDPPQRLAQGQAPVVEAIDPGSVVDDVIQPVAVEAMLEQALVSYTSGAASPWGQILPDFAPGTRIGIKVNCLNPLCPTSVPLVRALVSSLRAVLGVPPEQILVWDRRLDELEDGGFTEEAVGARVIGTVRSTSDDSGPGYEEEYCVVAGAKTTRLARILTEETDVTINVPVLKAHEVSGVTGAMKNTYGIIDNPGDFHGDLNTAMPAIYGLAPIRTRIRLTIIDALRASIAHGTADPTDATPRRIFLGQDPLAVDSYALDLANRLRTVADLPEVDGTRLAWLDNAFQAGLGAREYALTQIDRA
jgi:hypothetical protein